MRNAACIGVALVLMFFVGGASSGERLLSPEDFAKTFVTELLSRDPAAKVIGVDGLYLQVERSSNAGRIDVFLDNAYRTYQLRPEQLEEIVDDRVSSVLEQAVLPRGEVDLSRVVPLIKDVGYLNEIVSAAEARSGEKTEHAFAVERYNSDLVVLYAEDLDRSVRYLTEQELRGIDLPIDALRARAVDNLRSILPTVEVFGEGGTYLIAADGTYEASLILFDELWQSDKLALDGDPVVSIPARDVLLVTGSNDAEGLRTIAKMASDVAASAVYRLTEQLFVYRDGRFVRFER